jgi:hypothetical protein
MRSVRKDKFANVKLVLENFQFPAIVAFSETWLTSDDSDALFPCNDRYAIVRHDRQSGQCGGGVCFMIRNDVQYAVWDDSNPDVESLYVDIFCEGVKTRVGVVYRPPTNDTVYAEALINDLEAAMSVDCPKLIVGDFNAPGIDWDTFACTGLGVYNDLLEMVLVNNLSQCVHEPTRGNNVLDLVLTDDESLVEKVVVHPPLSSDHKIIEVGLRGTLPHVPPTKSKNYIKGDYDGINDFLGTVDWPALFTDFPTVEGMWSTLKEALDFCVEKFVPMRKSAYRSNRSVRTRTLQRRLNRLAKTMRADSGDVDTRRLAKRHASLVDDLKQSMLNDRQYEENKVLNSGDPKAFYRYIKKTTKCKDTIPALKKGDGSFETSADGKARILNDFFSSVFTVDNDVPLPRQPRTDARIGNVNFTRAKVAAAIDSMTDTLSSGPDGYPAYFIKRLRDMLCEPFALLFNTCMQTGDLPRVWLDAHIVPIHKKGSKNLPSNYRPVSLTSVICKTMERVIKVEVMKFLNDNKLLSEKQHGFRSKKSTSTQLLSTLNNWSLSVDQHQGLVDAIYLDFAKAFDSVVHSKLFSKLEDHGICGNLLAFFKAFLTGRRQLVQVDGCKSRFSEVVSGVPQGTVLGPLLFLIYVNSLSDEVLSCMIELFADDVKLYSGCQAQSVAANHVHLQEDLDRVMRWADMHQLCLAKNKCSVIRVGYQVDQPLSYTLGDVGLPEVDSVRDLGVVLQPNLKFDKYVDERKAKAMRAAGLVFKAFVSRRTGFLRSMYVTYVRSLLEYNTSVWNSLGIQSIDKLESVQRYFTRRIPELYGLDYRSRLERLDLEPLEVRRMKADLVDTFKIVKEKVSLSRSDFFEFGCPRTRGHQFKLFVPPARVDARKSAFGSRVVPMWNALSDNTVACNTVAAFKRQLRNYDWDEQISGHCFDL